MPYPAFYLGPADQNPGPDAYEAGTLNHFPSLQPSFSLPHLLPVCLCSQSKRCDGFLTACRHSRVGEGERNCKVKAQGPLYPPPTKERHCVVPTAILIKHPARLQVARTPEEAARGQYGRIHSARVAFLLPGESTQSQVPCIAWRDVLGVGGGGVTIGVHLSNESSCLFFLCVCQFWGRERKMSKQT